MRSRSARQRQRRPGVLLACALAWLACGGMNAQKSEPAPHAADALRRGRILLQAGQFAPAKKLFETLVQAHQDGVQAELGLGDAELGLRQFEAAEAAYRTVVAQQPELWQAHKNLVVVEAALHRWEEFDRERTVLRMARERGAPGISGRESDVIDSFTVAGEHWVVRAYFQPVGRSQTLYNFERFSPDGRVEAYISLEDAAAARAALTPGDVRIGAAPTPAEAAPHKAVYALNWYTGRAHGTLLRYTAGEPSYERVRRDVLRWLRGYPAPMRSPGP